MINPISYKVVDESLGAINVSYSNGIYSFYYPCTKPDECTEYELSLSPGIYKIELYGGGGGYTGERISLYRNVYNSGCVLQKNGGNVDCRGYSSMAGAGGYSAGYLRLSEKTKIFLAIGGSGSFGYKITQSDNAACYLKQNMLPGGYNGGGSGSNFYASPSNFGSSGGGGASDLRIINNDLFHRVIVAGGGGGTENPDGTMGGSDDGSGGAGGGEVAQSFRIDGVLKPSYAANQTFGFSFGNGEAARNGISLNPNGVKETGANSDRGGGGGGWFGGFSAQHNNGGGGGGSSFILTPQSIIPEAPIFIFDEFYTQIETNHYAFTNDSKYCLEFPTMSSGIWAGNGFAQITYITKSECSRLSFIIDFGTILLIIRLSFLCIFE